MRLSIRTLKDSLNIIYLISLLCLLRASTLQERVKIPIPIVRSFSTPSSCKTSIALSSTPIWYCAPFHRQYPQYQISRQTCYNSLKSGKTNKHLHIFYQDTRILNNKHLKKHSLPINPILCLISFPKTTS